MPAKGILSIIGRSMGGGTSGVSLSDGKDASARKVVARFSRGNIRLQQGRYITREQIDAGLQRCLENARKYGD